MIEPVFVYPTHDYQSYTDLKSLVKLAAFRSILVPEVDWTSQSPHIFCAGMPGGDWPVLPEPSKRPRCIFWNLERYALPSDHPWDEIWCSDRWFAGEQGARYVTLGSDPALCTPVPHESIYWYAHMSYLSHRRQQVMRKLIGTSTLAPNCWGEARNLALLSSKEMLCIHQDELPIIEPLRYALAAAYMLPIVAEWCHDFWPWKVAMELKQDDIDTRLYRLHTPLSFPLFRDCVMEALCES